MDKDTLIKFIEFLSSVEELAQGVMLHTGMETASSVIDKCEKLKIELQGEFRKC